MKFLFLFGTLTVLAIILDIIWTTLWIDGGAGFITHRLSNMVWKMISKIPFGKELSGPITLMSVLLTWIALLWLGWTLVFASHPYSISSTLNDQPILWENFIYYAGYTIFTLGSGDYAPTSPFWQILTNLASGTGTLFLALGTSYILTIVGAVVDKRTFARGFFSMGASSDEILIDSWNGENFSEIDSSLASLAGELSGLAVRHKAYPLLHYYHTKERTEASALAIPIFDNLLSVLEYGIEEKAKPNPIVLKKARNAVEDYLATLEDAYITIPEEPLILPDLERLAKEKLPVIENEAFEMKMAVVKNRRRKLHGLLAEDMWKEEDLNSL